MVVDDEATVRAGIDAILAAYLSPKVTRRVIAELSTTAGGRMSRAARAREQTQQLTAREPEVLALVGAGLSNAEIGRRLHLVEGTVKAHVSTILTRSA